MKYYGGGAYYGFSPSQAVYYDAANASSTLVPDTYNVSLNGRNYMVDLSQPFYRQLRRQLEPLIRTQADTSNEPGEQSMDPNGLWRRSYEDWRLGAGQRYLDRNTSQDNAYWVSQGVDTITTAWQVSLLPDVVSAKATSSQDPILAVANGYVYLLEYNTSTVYYTAQSNLVPGASPSWTTLSGMPADACSSIASDGYNIYLACGGDGVYSGVGGSTISQYFSTSIDSAAMLGYANGRLMLGSTNNVYNIVANSLPTALMTLGDANARFQCFTGGNNYLYMGVNSQSVGYIYGTQTTADGTTLTAPTVQTQLPNGELIYSMCGYLGYLVLGTSLGVRVCQQGSTGVTLGTLIPTPGLVQCMAPYGSFVWFGFENYSGTSTGLGKLSLENFVVQGILPAYQSDRMYTGQGAITSLVITPKGMPVWGVNNVGVFIDSTDLVASGTVQSGYILYDLTDPKVPALLDVQGAAVQEFGTYTVSLSTDGNAFELVGSAMAGALITNTFQLQQGSGSRFEVLLTLLRDANTPTAGPTITRWTLRSYPAPLRPKTWQLPLVLDEHIVTAAAMAQPFDPEVEINALEAMANNGTPVLYQEGKESYLVFVTDVSFIARNLTSDKHYFNGLALVNIQSIPVPTSMYL